MFTVTTRRGTTVTHEAQCDPGATLARWAATEHERATLAREGTVTLARAGGLALTVTAHAVAHGATVRPDGHVSVSVAKRADADPADVLAAARAAAARRGFLAADFAITSWADRDAMLVSLEAVAA